MGDSETITIDLGEPGWLEQSAQCFKDLVDKKHTNLVLQAESAAAPDLPEAQCIAVLYQFAERNGIALSTSGASAEFIETFGRFGFEDLMAELGGAADV